MLACRVTAWAGIGLTLAAGALLKQILCVWSSDLANLCSSCTLPIKINLIKQVILSLTSIWHLPNQLFNNDLCTPAKDYMTNKLLYQTMCMTAILYFYNVTCCLKRFYGAKYPKDTILIAQYFKTFITSQQNNVTFKLSKDNYI